MLTNERVSNKSLVQAALNAMRLAGHQLERVPKRGRAMIYRLSNGETVRVRTSNDHLLVVAVDRDSPDAKLSIEGTDHLLIAMPEVARTPGPVQVYFVPTNVAEEAVRTSHKAWLDTNPKTKGDNRAWVIWFNEEGPSTSNYYSQKWAQYRLNENVEISEAEETPPVKASIPSENRLRDAIEAAKRQIAQMAGVTTDAVKISIDFN